MIRLESVAISVLGALLGIGLGLAFGISLQHALAGQGIPVLSIPSLQLGRVRRARLFPARRAARMDVLRAVTTE